MSGKINSSADVARFLFFVALAALILFYCCGRSLGQGISGTGDRIARGGGTLRAEPDGAFTFTTPNAKGINIFCISTVPAVSLPGQVRYYCDANTATLRYSVNGGSYLQWTNPGAGAGTVSSVALSLPSIFSVAGSPITSAGTLAATFATQSANSFLRGPVSGAAAPPGFGLIVEADIPGLNASKITAGALTTARGGTGLSTFTFGDTLYINGAGAFTALAGNVTSSRKFLTQTGTGALSAVPAWNVLAAADVPPITLSSAANGGVAGTLGINNGGTGLTATGNANSFLGTNAAGNALQYWNLVGGSNVAITRLGNDVTISAIGTLSGDFRATDGAFATPSFSFTNETTLGLYRHASGVLGFAAPTMRQEAAARPTQEYITTGTTGKGRTFSAISNWIGLSQNAFYDGANWFLDDTSRGGAVVLSDTQVASSPSVRFNLIAAGNNPASARLVTPLVVSATGMALTSPAALTWGDNTAQSSAFRRDEVIELFNERTPFSGTDTSGVYVNALSVAAGGPANGTVQSYIADITLNPSDFAGATLALETVQHCTGSGSGSCTWELYNVTDAAQVIEISTQYLQNYPLSRSSAFSLTGSGRKRYIMRYKVGLSGAGNQATLWRARLIVRPSYSFCGYGGLAQCAP